MTTRAKLLTTLATAIVTVAATGAGPALARPGCPSGCHPHAVDGTSNTVLFGELVPHLMEEEGLFY